MGMRPQNLLFGSEGNLGLVTGYNQDTQTTWVQEYASAVFPSWQKGVDFLRGTFSYKLHSGQCSIGG